MVCVNHQGCVQVHDDGLDLGGELRLETSALRSTWRALFEAQHQPTEVEERRRTRPFDASRGCGTNEVEVAIPAAASPMCSVDSGDTPRTRKKHLDFQDTVTSGGNLSFGSHLWLAVLDLLPVTLS